MMKHLFSSLLFAVILIIHGIHGMMLPESAVDESDSSEYSYYTCPRLVGIRYREYGDSKSSRYTRIDRHCHGTMVDRYWVATTADCINSVKQMSGSGNINFWKIFFAAGDSEKNYDVESIYIPKGEYLVTEEQNYQIAFLKLKEPGLYFMPGEAGNCTGLEDETSADGQTDNEDTDTSNSYTGSRAIMSHDDSYPLKNMDDSDADMTQKLYPGCPLDNNQLGIVTWSFLHTMTAHFPEHPTKAQQNQMQEFMYLFAMLYPYPCDECAAPYRYNTLKNPPDASSRDSISQWLCNIHNETKFRDSHGENPPFDCKRVNERWRDGWKDGSCSRNTVNSVRGQ